MSDTNGSSHTIRALTELRERILRGDLQGGERLLEVQTAEMLEISRTPVREAMSRLAEEGLLERGKSGGFVVRAFTTDDVYDAIELRGVLEGTAARLAAERGAVPRLLEEIQAVVAALDECFGEAANEINFDSYSSLNARFHDLLARLSGSRIVERELNRVTQLPFASPSAFLPDKIQLATPRSSLDLAQAQHREIVAAITNREGARAESLAREHARTARRDLEMALSRRSGPSSAVAGLSLIVNE